MSEAYFTDNDFVLSLLVAAPPGEWVGHLYEKTKTMVHSRISDLRRDGHVIESKCFGVGDWRYRLAPQAP